MKIIVDSVINRNGDNNNMICVCVKIEDATFYRKFNE